MIGEQNTTPYSNLIFVPAFLLMALGVAVVSVFYPVLAMASISLFIAGTISLLISIRWPEAFLILALWTNFMKSAYIPGLTVGEFGATPYMMFTSIAAFGFFVQILTGKRRLILPAGFWFFLLFAVFTTISLLVVQNFRLAFGVYVRTLLDWMLFFSLVQMLTDWQRVRQLITVLLIQALIMTGWGIVSGIQLEITGAFPRTLFFWRQYQKNDFATYLGFVLVLALATFSLSKSRRRKLLAIVLMGFVPIGWLFTFSRGGFLAIVTCLIVFLALERNKILLRRSFLATLLVSCIGLGVLLFGPPNVRSLAIDGLRSIVTAESETARHTFTIDLRLELAQAAAEVVATHPLLGVGVNQWQFYSPITTRVYDPQADEFRVTGYSIHNRYLLIAANNGLIALAGYIGFLTAVLIYSLRWRRFVKSWMRTYLHIFIAAVLGMQVSLLFAPSMTWEWPAFGILIGIANVAKMEKWKVG